MGLLNLLWGGLVLSHYATYKEVKRAGDAATQEWTKKEHQRQKEIAKKLDLYYRRNSLTPELDINVDFYSDGSLRHDSNTQRNYPKGQYFCSSMGYDANGNLAGPDVPRPPK